MNATPAPAALTPPTPVPGRRRPDPAFEAFVVLRVLYAAVPIVFGLDKFTHLLTDWSKYLTPAVSDVAPVDAGRTMMIVGAVEILAGLVVLVSPRVGGYLVAAWLGAIVINLVSLTGYADVAGRDLALLVGAIVLARLAQARHAAEVAAEESRWSGVLSRGDGAAVGGARR